MNWYFGKEPQQHDLKIDSEESGQLKLIRKRVAPRTIALSGRGKNFEEVLQSIDLGVSADASVYLTDSAVNTINAFAATNAHRYCHLPKEKGPGHPAHVPISV